MIRHMWPWPKKRKSANDLDHIQRRSSRNYQKCIERSYSSRETNLHSSDLRLVIMDHDSSRRSSKRVIYDSLTVVPILPGEVVSPEIRVSECKRFKLLRKKKDVSSLAHLIWGSGPTHHGADSIKFHHLHCNHLMVSRVFPMPRAVNKDLYNQTDSVSSDSESQYTPTVQSVDALGMGFRNGLTNQDPPEKFQRVRNTSLNIESDESDEFRAFSPPHRLSKNRRIQMSHETSLCEPVTSPLNIRKPRSRMSSIGSQPDDGNSSLGSHGYYYPPDEKQVALAIVFTHTERSFVFQHIPLIEAEMARLECRIATAALYSKGFLENVHRAWEEFHSAVCMLFNAPRLKMPMWLTLTDKVADDFSITRGFTDQLASLIRKLDTKETNFFLSNLVSTVLMYHMSWVASVAAARGAVPPKFHFESRIIGAMENEEIGSIPYNPHMAQYLEISGNIGHVNRNTKTVVCGPGEDADLITHLLQCLSYFIRCSVVQASQRRCETDPLPVYRPFSPEFVGSPESSCGELSLSPEKVPGDLDFTGPLYIEPPDVMVESLSDLSPIDATDFLGRSMLAGPSTAFSPHFVISGLIRDGTNIDKAFERMCDDVSSSLEPDYLHRASSSMSSSVASSTYEIQGPDSVIVIADVSDNTVKVLSGEGVGTVTTPSETIVSMFENFKDLQGAGMCPKFLLGYLEDGLYGVLQKSLGLVELVTGEPDVRPEIKSSNYLSSDRVRRVLECEHSDLRLILNVASVYYPPVLSSVT